MYVEYNHNNSGGHWWLDDKDWHKLAAAGWKVWWHGLDAQYDAKGMQVLDSDGLPVLFSKTTDPNNDQGVPQQRFLGALATHAFRAGLSLEDAIDEWEQITGQDHNEQGCDCCGRPHYFSEC